MELIKVLKEKLENREKGQTDFYVDCKYDDPVGQDAIKDTLALIKVAHESHCHFEVVFILKIGKFTLDSLSFKDIKLLKATKNEPERIVISYNNTLLSHDTTMNVDDITCISFDLKYCSDNSQEGDE